MKQAKKMWYNTYINNEDVNFGVGTNKKYTVSVLVRVQPPKQKLGL